MLRERLTRRMLLAAVPMTLITACSESSANNSFTLRRDIRNGKEELFLPFGSTHPETGVYTLILEPTPQKVLNTGRASYEQNFTEGNLKILFRLRQVNPDSVDVGFQIGQKNEGFAKTQMSVTVELTTLNTDYKISVAWRDWLVQDIKLNGTSISRYDLTTDKLFKKEW